MVLMLSFACCDYDRMKVIKDGRVKPEGIEVTFLNYRIGETLVQILFSFMTEMIMFLKILPTAKVSRNRSLGTVPVAVLGPHTQLRATTFHRSAGVSFVLPPSLIHIP